VPEIIPGSRIPGDAPTAAEQFRSSTSPAAGADSR
jgi:hypothetical protein